MEGIARSQTVLSLEQGKSGLTRHQCSSTLADFVDDDDVDNKNELNGVMTPVAGYLGEVSI